MASGSALLVVLVLLVSTVYEVVPIRTAFGGAVGIGALILVFYVLFRTGLNLRFSDPSLTAEQIGSATLLLAYVMSASPQARHVLVILYVMPLLFGVLRLTTFRLLALALLTLVAHGVVVWHSARGASTSDLRIDLLQLAVLAVLLPWFAVMGGYTNQLRRRLSDSNRALAGDMERIEQLALRDVLTGVYNRRHLDDVLVRAQSRSLRLGTALSLCLIDLDHFKSVNDTYGHPAGDSVLRHFSTLAAADLRAGDVLGRFGGEEFLLVLPDGDLPEALAAAERIRERVAEAKFPGLPADRQVTVTIGCALLAPDERVSDLIARLDASLYAGKKAGRNRVTSA